MADLITSLGAALLPRLNLTKEQTRCRFILRRRVAISLMPDVEGRHTAVHAVEDAAARPHQQLQDLVQEERDVDIIPGLERIPFHRDNSLVVVNIPLNDSFEGGQLMYALPSADDIAWGKEGLDQAERDIRGGACIAFPRCRPGDASVHDCSTVHGVSGLLSGVRCSLFAVFDGI